jgi:hypothetical protein
VLAFQLNSSIKLQPATMGDWYGHDELKGHGR